VLPLACVFKVRAVRVSPAAPGMHRAAVRAVQLLCIASRELRSSAISRPADRAGRPPVLVCTAERRGRRPLQAGDRDSRRDVEVVVGLAGGRPRCLHILKKVWTAWAASSQPSAGLVQPLSGVLRRCDALRARCGVVRHGQMR